VEPHKILNRWKNYFCQLLNVCGAGGVRQTEIHTAEPFVPEPSASEIEVAVGKPKRYESPGVGLHSSRSDSGRRGNIAFGD
jgi:hypothetical protein